MEIYDFKCVFSYISPIEKKMCKQSVLISSSVCSQMLCLTVTLFAFLVNISWCDFEARISEISQVVVVESDDLYFLREIIYARDYG